MGYSPPEKRGSMEEIQHLATLLANSLPEEIHPLDCVVILRRAAELIARRLRGRKWSGAERAGDRRPRPSEQDSRPPARIEKVILDEAERVDPPSTWRHE